MTKKLRIEEARKILAEQENMPPDFEVLAVAWAPSAGCFVVKWRDPAQKEMYDAGVADPDSGEARNAYGEKPEKDMFSAVFFNEAPDGGKEIPAAELLSDKELGEMKKTGDVKVVDVA